jgi:hypothetical protein
MLSAEWHVSSGWRGGSVINQKGTTWFIFIGLLLVISPAQAQYVKSYEPYSCHLLANEQRRTVAIIAIRASFSSGWKNNVGSTTAGPSAGCPIRTTPSAADQLLNLFAIEPPTHQQRLGNDIDVSLIAVDQR